MSEKKSKLGIIADKIDKGFTAIVAVVYVIMIGVVLLQIFARVCLPQVPAWTEEASRYLQVYLVAFSAGLAVKYDAFVSVDTLFNYLKPKAASYIKLFDQVIALVLFVFCFRYSFDMYKLGIPRTAVSMVSITMNYVYFSMILLCGCVVVSTIRKIVNMIIAMKGEKK